MARLLAIRLMAAGLLAVGLLMAAGNTAAAQPRDARAAEAREMSLEEALALSGEQNYAVRMADADIRIARSRYWQTHAAFLPSISIAETGVSTDDPLSVFGFRLKQEAVTTADFNPDRLNAPDPYENFTTRFEVHQPVFNAGMLYRRSAVKSQVNASREQFESTVQQTRYRVKDTYYRLLLAGRQLEVISQSLEAAEEMERQAMDYYEEEMIGRDEYLAARVRLLELQSRRQEILDQKETVQDNLKFLLGLDKRVTIVPTDSMPRPRFSHERFEGVNARNSGLEALRYRVEAARKMVKSARAGFVPSLNLFGNYEFNDEVLFGTAGESYLVGATLKWNLFDGFSKAGKMMESKAELKKAELAHESRSFENKLETDQARRSLKQAETQLDLAEATVEQAAENFRIRSDRYREGMVRTSDLLEAETKWSQARMQRLNALYMYHLSLARLELLLEREW